MSLVWCHLNSMVTSAHIALLYFLPTTGYTDLNNAAAGLISTMTILNTASRHTSCLFPSLSIKGMNDSLNLCLWDLDSWGSEWIYDKNISKYLSSFKILLCCAVDADQSAASQCRLVNNVIRAWEHCTALSRKISTAARVTIQFKSVPRKLYPSSAALNKWLQ